MKLARWNSADSVRSGHGLDVFGRELTAIDSAGARNDRRNISDHQGCGAAGDFSGSEFANQPRGIAQSVVRHELIHRSHFFRQPFTEQCGAFLHGGRWILNRFYAGVHVGHLSLSSQDSPSRYAADVIYRLRPRCLGNPCHFNRRAVAWLQVDGISTISNLVDFPFDLSKLAAVQCSPQRDFSSESRQSRELISRVDHGQRQARFETSGKSAHISTSAALTARNAGWGRGEHFSQERTVVHFVLQEKIATPGSFVTRWHIGGSVAAIGGNYYRPRAARTSGVCAA